LARCIIGLHYRASLSIMRLILATLLLSSLTLLSCKNASQVSEWTSIAADQYNVFPDLSYSAVNNTQLTLDIYQPRETRVPVPTVIYFHGGGWSYSDKNQSTLQLLPYLK